MREPLPVEIPSNRTSLDDDGDDSSLLSRRRSGSPAH